MEECRITALMPLKNYHPVYLGKAVESVIGQSCPRWQLLIIVEESDFNDFRNILEKVLADPRIKMIKNEGHKLAGALNTGMRHAQTDFVAILLADDMWSSDAIAVLGERIRQLPHVDFFHSSRRYIDENDQPISSVYQSRQNFSLADFLVSSPVKHLLCWRKDKALAFGGMDGSIELGPDDYDFPWSMAERGAVFMALRECLYLYREHRECYRLTTHCPLDMHIEMIRKIMRKHGASESSIRTKIAGAKRSYLRQCLYRSRLDQRIKEKLGYNPRWGWRPKYR